MLIPETKAALVPSIHRAPLMGSTVSPLPGQGMEPATEGTQRGRVQRLLGMMVPQLRLCSLPRRRGLASCAVREGRARQALAEAAEQVLTSFRRACRELVPRERGAVVEKAVEREVVGLQGSYGASQPAGDVVPGSRRAKCEDEGGEVRTKVEGVRGWNV